ncbi:MAG: hypothetical protein HY288_08530 [Planctomycetia bacterium]|nr:hypothetical protein [Planctomycetia bacterium]
MFESDSLPNQRARFKTIDRQNVFFHYTFQERNTRRESPNSPAKTAAALAAASTRPLAPLVAGPYNAALPGDICRSNN